MYDLIRGASVRRFSFPTEFDVCSSLHSRTRMGVPDRLCGLSRRFYSKSDAAKRHNLCCLPYKAGNGLSGQPCRRQTSPSGRTTRQRGGRAGILLSASKQGESVLNSHLSAQGRYYHCELSIKEITHVYKYSDQHIREGVPGASSFSTHRDGPRRPAGRSRTAQCMVESGGIAACLSFVVCIHSGRLRRPGVGITPCRNYPVSVGRVVSLQMREAEFPLRLSGAFWLVCRTVPSITASLSHSPKNSTRTRSPTSGTE